jgi:glutathione S-transferase
VATLHRCPTPTDRLCACGRVARELRRHGVRYGEVRVPFRRRGRPQVQALSGQDRAPPLVLDGEPICDSRRIVEHLEWLASRPRG